MLGSQIGNYKIISLLGEGGMANVYLAQHQSLGYNVAIKLLKDEYVLNSNIRKRSLAEARNLAKMSHPNIIKVTDLIDARDIVAFVMEYIEGQTLEDFLSEKGKLTSLEIEGLFNQMILAVEYIHEQGLIHRDIKPSNFMVTKNGQIKLLDFGIAKNNNEGAVDYIKTGLAQQMGTPLYMSPEQVRSTSEITKETDYYSLGVVLWQMVMNKKPYDSTEFSLPEIQVSILKEQLPLTNTIWDSTIQKSTEKDPIKRSLKFTCNRDLDSKTISDTLIDTEISNPNIKEKEGREYFNFKNVIIGSGILFFILIFLFNLIDESKDKSEKKVQQKHIFPKIIRHPLPKSKLKIGQKFKGGIIFELDNSTNHGKVCSEKDLGEYNWTNSINVCENLNENGYSDWYLPSQSELKLIYSQKIFIIGFSDKLYYWSSTNKSNKANWQSFYTGENCSNFKSQIGYVRAIRIF